MWICKLFRNDSNELFHHYNSYQWKILKNIYEILLLSLQKLNNRQFELLLQFFTKINPISLQTINSATLEVWVSLTLDRSDRFLVKLLISFFHLKHFHFHQTFQFDNFFAEFAAFRGITLNNWKVIFERAAKSVE